MQKRKTAAEKKAEQAEQKKALGALDRLYDNYVVLAPTYDEDYGKEIHEALRILARSIHGEPTGRQRSYLCSVCHEAYATHWTELLELFLVSHHRLCDCCTSCKDQLLAEGKLFSVDGQPVAPPLAGEEGAQA